MREETRERDGNLLCIPAPATGAPPDTITWGNQTAGRAAPDEGKRCATPITQEGAAGGDGAG